MILAAPVARLACSLDAKHVYDSSALQGVCTVDGAPLFAHYDERPMKREDVARRPFSLWRYRERLPMTAAPVTLDEGGTPLLRAAALERRLRLGSDHPIFIKDESRNPTGSFKARGMSVAVTVARDLGARALVAPSAGNAGGALAAYGARAGLPVTVFLPRDTPLLLIEEARGYGADVRLVDGLIDAAGRAAAAFAARTGAFNVATLREPYRVEGKKTMAYELAEQLPWAGFAPVPALIVYPTGGGTGLVGMWKAFAELQALGWIDGARPRMLSVQADGCAPIVHAYDDGAATAARVENAATTAWGLRVPAALGDRAILAAVRNSGGAAVAVDEDALATEAAWLRTNEGIDAAEEGGAALAGLCAYAAREALPPGPIVLFNTGSALKYAPRGLAAEALPRER